MTMTKIKLVVIELAKWSLVFWLLYPLIWIQDKYVSFPRVMAGILLFVVFSGKMLYDMMVNKRNHHYERSNAADLLATLGMVIVVAVIVGLFVVILGFALLGQMQQATAPQE
jgi:hypothetical protein